jgi:hypothetical protein
MNSRKFLFSSILALTSLIFLTNCKKDKDTPVDKPDLVFYGLTSSNQLVTYNAKTPETTSASVAVTGLQTGETLLAIDFRPATGQLYGLGSTSRLYAINHLTGRATAIGTAPFTPAISGNVAGFDFNPTVDRIRLVTSTGQNLRLHPETGVVAATDGNITPASAAITAVAYSNNVAGSSATTLFDIDRQSGKLFKQDPPNNGALVEIGSLGIGAFTDGSFDISPDNAVALAALTVGSTNVLYRIDVNTGKATALGNLGTTITGLAIPTNPVAYAVDQSDNLLIFNLNSPGATISKAITGLQTGETVLGIDMRPATGQLYVLGSTSRIYTLNLSTGAAALIGGQFSTLLAGTSFGFDFNPTVDRIRVVSNTGQNLRLHPETGAIAATDLPLNPGTPMVSAAAYTNNFAGATTTVLYDIDHGTDKLYMQNPPNNGVLVEVGALGVNVEEANGFDIGGTTGKAYAMLRVGSSTKLYTVNLSTGGVTAVGDFAFNVKGFAVGLGF